MRSRHAFRLLVCLALVVFLSGCSQLNRIIGLEEDDWKTWTPDNTAVQIAQDGQVTETIFETLDRSYYDVDELQDLIARSVREYREANGEESISVPVFEFAEGKIHLVLVYRSVDDFSAYNQLVLFNGSMLDAEMQGYLFSNTFSRVEGSEIREKELPASEVLSHKEYRAAISDGTHIVQVPGKIRYVSTGAQLLNSHTARPGGMTGQREEKGLLLPSNNVYYKEGERKMDLQDLLLETELSGDELDRSYLYVLYEKDAPGEAGGE